MPGTGPGRGVPWWRHWRGKLRTWRHEPGVDNVMDQARPGRVVARIGGQST